MTPKGKALFFVGGGLLVVLVLSQTGNRRDPSAEFERRFPGFIEANAGSIQKLSKRPKSDARDKAIQAARENLQWAERYKRTNVDSDVVAEANEARMRSYAASESEGPPPMRTSVY